LGKASGHTGLALALTGCWKTVQQAAILYGEEYQKPGARLPTLDPPKRHRHYIFFHHGTVSGGSREWKALELIPPDMHASINV
jgi:hypothetical protein